MKKIKVFECFAGIGAQHRAMFNLFNNDELLEKNGINKEKYGYEIVGTSEWFIDAIISYDRIHHGEQNTYRNYNNLLLDDMLAYIETYTLSKDSKTPYSFESIKRFDYDYIRELFIALKRNKNFGSIVDIKGDKVLSLPKIDLLTYSFPCFTAGHKITTNNGYKNIEDIEIGDLVLTHKNRYKKVVVPMQKTSNHIFKIIVSNVDKVLEVTAEHPFYVLEKDNLNKAPEWIDVKDLDKDKHYLLKHNNLFANNLSTCGLYELIEIESITLEYKEIEVYNFEVEDDNSYVVENIIVHNCQDISLAGAGRGLEEGSNTRSGLLWEIKRILEELKVESKLPQYLLMENVKSIVNPKHYKGWKVFEDFLTSLGYKNTMIVLNAKDVGIPQSRDRVFCISELDGTINFNIDNKTKLEKTLKEFLDVDNPLYIDEYKAAMPNNTISRREIIEDSKKLNNLDYCFTITTKADRKPNPGVFWCNENGMLIENEAKDWYINGPDITGKSAYRYLTGREALLLMGFTNEDYDALKSIGMRANEIYMFSGNSIVVNKLEAIFVEIMKRFR